MDYGEGYFPLDTLDDGIEYLTGYLEFFSAKNPAVQIIQKLLLKMK